MSMRNVVFDVPPTNRELYSNSEDYRNAVNSNADFNTLIFTNFLRPPYTEQCDRFIKATEKPEGTNPLRSVVEKTARFAGELSLYASRFDSFKPNKVNAFTLPIKDHPSIKLPHLKYSTDLHALIVFNGFCVLTAKHDKDRDMFRNWTLGPGSLAFIFAPVHPTVEAMGFSRPKNHHEHLIKRAEKGTSVALISSSRSNVNPTN